MPAYVTVAELREYLNQAQAGATVDALLTKVIARASEMVDDVLEFSFGDGTYPAASVRSLPSVQSQYLFVPPHESGSITTVTYLGVAMSGWSAGTPNPKHRVWLYLPGGWPTGRVDVTAKWGYGQLPESVKEVVLELCVNIWRGKSRGLFSDVIGVDGSGAVGYAGALTNQQKMILEKTRKRYREVAF